MDWYHSHASKASISLKKLNLIILNKFLHKAFCALLKSKIFKSTLNSKCYFKVYGRVNLSDVKLINKK